MIIAALRDGPYDLVLLLHIGAAIVGFGAVVWNPLLGAEAKKRPGAGGLAVSEATLALNRYGEFAIYTMPVTGILLVLMSDKAWDFGDLWISAAFLLYLIGLGIAHAVLTKQSKRLLELQQHALGTGTPPPTAEVALIENRLRAFGTVNHLILLVIIVLMIWKPGA